MKIEKIDWPFYENRRPDCKVKYLIIHSFAFPIARILDIWKEFGVGPHYLIDEKGKIMQFVSEDNVAYHAGKSFWKGDTGLNFSSIGIELYSPSFGQEAYSEKQIESLIILAKDVMKRNGIFSRNVLGHSDIAPTRKVDPGKAFPWKKLSEYGIGVWPRESKESQITGKNIKELLASIGYDVSDEKAALLAFLRHFMPEKISKEADVFAMEDNLKENIKKMQNPDKDIVSFLLNTFSMFKE